MKQVGKVLLVLGGLFVAGMVAWGVIATRGCA